MGTQRPPSAPGYLPRLLPRLVRDDKNLTITDTETGETFPEERLDEYARGKLDAAIAKLATAWIVAKARRGAQP